MTEFVRQQNQEQGHGVRQAIQQQTGMVEQINERFEILDEIEARQIALEMKLNARTERRSAEQRQQKERQRDQNRPRLMQA